MHGPGLQLGGRAEHGVERATHHKRVRHISFMCRVCAHMQIPFMIVIGCSVFTDAIHMEDHTYGIKKYPPTKIHSLT